MIGRVHFHTLSAMTILFWLASAGATWCAFFDTRPPVDILGGQVVSYDAASHVVLIEWSAVKNRHCPGVRTGWLREAGDEPPPHVVVPLPEVTLPPENFRGPPAPHGSLVHWRTAVEVPPYLDGDLIYKPEWDFACNPVQSIFPLRVPGPFITVRQDG